MLNLEKVKSELEKHGYKYENNIFQKQVIVINFFISRLFLVEMRRENML